MRRNLHGGVPATLQPPSGHGRPANEASVLEGVLETRGPGKVGRWEQRWFRLEGAVLASFASADASTAQHSIPIREISSLSFERDKCECSFVVQGTKVRLRAEGERLAWTWFRALLEMVQLHAIDCEDDNLPSAREGSPSSPRVSTWELEGLRRPPLSEQEPFQRQAARSHSPPHANAEACCWTPPTAPRTPRMGEERRGATQAAAAGRRPAAERPGASRPAGGSREPPARCAQLHSLHEARLQRREELRRKSITSDRDAALKATCRERSPQEVADKLFNDHRVAQERAAHLQRRLEEEEREALNRTRFRKQLAHCPTAPLAAAREASERLHREHQRREERQRQREERAARTVSMLMETSSGSSACGSSSRHLELYGHAQTRSSMLDQRRREKEEAEMERLADLTVHKRRGPVDSGRFEDLYAEHEVRSRRLAQRQELKRRMELAELQEFQQAVREANVRSWSRWSPRRNRLDLAQGSSDEERSRCASPRAKAESHEPPGRPRSSPPGRGRCPERTRERAQASKRPSPEPAAPEDVLLAAVLAAVQARCGGSAGSTSGLKHLAVPLKAAMAAFREAVAACAQGEGHAALCARPSQQLFHDSRLLPETDGWRSCVEPNPIRQVEEDLDSLLSSAARAQATLQRLIAPSQDGAPWAAGTSRASPGAVPWALFAHNPGPKPRAAAEIKAFVLFQPAAGDRRYRHLLDLARLSLVFANSRLLLDGLERIISQFQVLDVRNHFRAPGRMGDRCVEVLLAVEVDVGGISMPHVCELRLEEHAFYAARMEAGQHVERFLCGLREQYARPSRHIEACIYLARRVLATPPESHGLRILRRHLARRFGSCVACWRQALGNRRQLNFRLFRDVCNSLKLREHAPAYWTELEAGRGGCISLLEFDPEALGLLLRLRARMLALLGSESLDQELLFRRLTVNIKLANAGQLQAGEFRSVGRACGLSPEETDRAFGHLECRGGGSVAAADLWWLACLPALVDTQAALLEAAQQTLRPATPSSTGGGPEGLQAVAEAAGGGSGPLPAAAANFGPGRPTSPRSPRARSSSASPSAPASPRGAVAEEDHLSTAARRGQSAPVAPSGGEQAAASWEAAAWGWPRRASGAWRESPARLGRSGAMAGPRLPRHAWDRPRLAGDQHLPGPGFSHGFWPTLEEVGEGEEPSPEPLAAPSPGSQAADSPGASSRTSSPVEPPSLWPDEPCSGLAPEAQRLLSTSRSSVAWASPWAGWEVADVEEEPPARTEEENPLEVF